MQIIAIFLIANGDYLILIVSISGILFLILTAFSIEKIFFVLVFYICCFATKGYMTNFPGFSLPYTTQIAYPLFALLLIYWGIYSTKHSQSIRMNEFDVAILIYIATMSIGVINGLLQNYGRSTVLGDFISIPFTLSFFIFLYSPLRKYIKTYYDLLLICAVFVSLHFIYAVVNYKTLFFLFRIVSRHVHLAQFAIPYIMATVIYSRSKKRKIIFMCLLPLVLLSVII